MVITFSTFSHASQIGKLSLGLLSPQGFVGGNYEKNITINEEYSYSPTLGVGLDATGFLKTAGIRGFRKYSVDESKWFNRCGLFIFKDCERFYTASTYMHHTDGGTTTVDKTSQDLEFTTSSGWLSSLSLGTRSLINQKWVLDFEISQRVLLAGMEVDQKKGPTNSSERQSIEDFRTALGFSFGIGFVW
jgi:hypothetical protein